LAASVPLFAQTAPSAKATIKNAAGDVVGTLTITAGRGGAVTMSGKLSKLPPGTHAIHIHTAGQCTAPGFTTAGGHFNPGMKQHGKDNPMGSHAGDLANFTADASGNATINDPVPGVSLGSGADSLFHEGGTAIVIHADPDDYKTDP